MISYRYVAVYLMPDGARAHQPADGIALIDVPPAVFVARQKIALQVLYGAAYDPDDRNGPRRVDEVLRVYSALRVPDGALTPEEAEAFL